MSEQIEKFIECQNGPKMEQKKGPQFFQCFNSIKKPLTGFFWAMIASITTTIGHVAQKKTTFFNEFDNSAMRFALQLLVLFIFALVTRASLVGQRVNLKLLLARGSVSVGGVIAYLAAMKLIDPSDAVSLFSCNVIFVAILSRIFMKEKFTVLHFFAFIFFVPGILFITQPSFLVTIDTQLNHTIVLESNEFALSKSKGTFYTVIGYLLVVYASLMNALATILIKRLSENKTHFSTINLYASYFGLPVSVIFMIIANQCLPSYAKDWSLVNSEPFSFVWEVIYALISAFGGVFSQVFWIISLKYDDATKIMMYRTTDLLFTFLWQYFFLNITSNMLSIVGSILLGLGMITVMGVKLFEKDEEAIRTNKQDLDTNFEKSSQKTFSLKKFLLYKF